MLEVILELFVAKTIFNCLFNKIKKLSQCPINEVCQTNIGTAWWLPD